MGETVVAFSVEIFDKQCQAVAGFNLSEVTPPAEVRAFLEGVETPNINSPTIDQTMVVSLTNGSLLRTAPKMTLRFLGAVHF